MATERQRKTEFLDQMIQAVSQIPVEQVVGAVVDLHPSGRHLQGLCPFHADHRLGSFIVTPEKGLWHCFTDGIGGSQIRFEMMYYKLGFLDASFKLALEYGIITPEECALYSKKRYDTEFVSHLENKTEKAAAAQVVRVERADRDVINNVYTAMAQCCGLSPEHRKHLLNERHLSPDNLQDYFTFPTRRGDLQKKILLTLGEAKAMQLYGRSLRECSREEIEKVDASLQRVKDQFNRVPGFFTNEKGVIDFSSYKGIGFLVRDEHRKACGIQVRRDVVKPGEQRYVWFSSSFATARAELSGGAPSGAPGGVVFAKTQPANGVCITEGRFKAEKIASVGCDAVYVSGVSSWKAVMRSVTELTRQRQKKHVFLMFDADMLSNSAVHRQLAALASALESEGIRSTVILWPKEMGKGFDDFVNKQGLAKYKQYMRSLPYREFESRYTQALRDVCDALQIESEREVAGNPEKSLKYSSLLQQKAEEYTGITSARPA